MPNNNNKKAPEETKALSGLLLLIVLCVLPFFKAVDCYRDVGTTGLPRPIVAEESCQPTFLRRFIH